MAAGNRPKSTYYSTTLNGITRAFDKPDDETVSRVNKIGKTVHEKYYDFISGKITGIHIRVPDNKPGETKFPKQLCIGLTDEDGTCELQTNFNGNVAKRIICSLDNINLKLPVTITIKKDTDDKGKPTLVTFINQREGGENISIKQAWTKENLPPWIPVRLNNEDTWDRSEELEKFEEIVKEFQTKLASKKMQGSDADKTDFSDFAPTKGETLKVEKKSQGVSAAEIGAKANDSFLDDDEPLPF